jgi:hypothetical protein
MPFGSGFARFAWRNRIPFDSDWNRSEAKGVFPTNERPEEFPPLQMAV